ncbi:hypothetical protein DMJ13_24190 [halophilic archaeon]|nr:hypothetical protein DMJ13_24190 [halophilic archaeon]
MPTVRREPTVTAPRSEVAATPSTGPIDDSPARRPFANAADAGGPTVPSSAAATAKRRNELSSGR